MQPEKKETKITKSGDTSDHPRTLAYRKRDDTWVEMEAEVLRMPEQFLPVGAKTKAPSGSGTTGDASTRRPLQDINGRVRVCMLLNTKSSRCISV